MRTIQKTSRGLGLRYYAALDLDPHLSILLDWFCIAIAGSRDFEFTIVKILSFVGLSVASLIDL